MGEDAVPSDREATEPEDLGVEADTGLVGAVGVETIPLVVLGSAVAVDVFDGADVVPDFRGDFDAPVTPGAVDDD